MFPAGDAGALAALMNSALGDRAAWLQGGFRDRTALDMFSVKTIVRKYHEVYRPGHADPA